MKALTFAAHFFLLIFLLSSTHLFCAELTSFQEEQASLVKSLPPIAVKGSPCAPVSYKGNLYCHTDALLYIIPANLNHNQQSLSHSKTPQLVVLDNGLILAYLTDGIVLLLDPQENKAIKIFGGSNNGSPRDIPPEPINLGEYKFKFKKSLVLEVLIEHKDSTWELTTISSRSRLKESLVFLDKTYSVVSRSKLRIEDSCVNPNSEIVEIEIGLGLQLPVIVSEQKKILAMVLRSQNNIIFFNTETNKILYKIAVGSLAQKAAILGNTLFVPSFGERLIYRYDLTNLFNSVSSK